MKDMQTSDVLVTLTRKYSSEIFSRRIHWLHTYEAYTTYHTILTEIAADHGARLNLLSLERNSAIWRLAEVQKLEFDGGD